MEVLGYWWNGCWGTATMKRVWLEQAPTGGPYVVRWRGGAWRDRDGRHAYTDPADAVAALRLLIGEDKAGWRGWVAIAA